jgi:rhodanese-related sulfurtransferase
MLSQGEKSVEGIVQVTYCSGPFCVLADEAVKILSEQGYNIRRLNEGYPEWKVKQMGMS